MLDRTPSPTSSTRAHVHQFPDRLGVLRVTETPDAITVAGDFSRYGPGVMLSELEAWMKPILKSINDDPRPARGYTTSVWGVITHFN